MDKKGIKRINKLLVHLDIEKINSDYSLLYFKKIEKVIDKNIGNNKILLILVSEKFDENKMFELIKLLHMGFRDFYNIDILNETNENGENFIQVAIKTGYSAEFIEKLLKEFGKSKTGYDYFVNCNITDIFGNTIIHTALLNDEQVNFSDYFTLLNALHKFTNFNQHTNYNLYDGVNIFSERPIDLLEKKYNLLGSKGYNGENFSDYLNYTALNHVISLFYNINFDLFMKQLTDDVDSNIKLIDKKIDYPDMLGSHHKKYDLKFPHQLLHLCVDKKYSDEDLVLKSIKRLIATGKMDVNYLENGLDIVSVAIINGFSNKFVIDLIKELSNTNFDKKYYFQIMCSAIYLSKNTKRDFYQIYEFLCENGFSLINEARLIDEKLLNIENDNNKEKLDILDVNRKLCWTNSAASFRYIYGLEQLQRENNIADFLKKIIAGFKTYNIDVKINNLKDYDECYMYYITLQKYLVKCPGYKNIKFNIIKSIVDIINKKYVDSIMCFNSEKLKEELMNACKLILEHCDDMDFINNIMSLNSEDDWFIYDDYKLDSESIAKQMVKKYMKN